MARISGIEIPDNKRTVISLTYIYGIGLTTSKEILEKAKIDGSIRVKDLSTEQMNGLRAIIAEKAGSLEGDLRREVRENIKRLREIGSYRGSRHSRALPSRGQRTKTNSRTLRGNKRVTMGSGRRPPASAT